MCNLFCSLFKDSTTSSCVTTENNRLVVVKMWGINGDRSFSGKFLDEFFPKKRSSSQFTTILCESARINVELFMVGDGTRRERHVILIK